MGELLQPADEGVHEVGPAANWNESRYIDFYDTTSGVGGWLRIGNRPNEGRAEMSVAINLPDGTDAFYFERAPIAANTLRSGNQEWEVLTPFDETIVRYEGPVLLLEDGWALTDPKVAFKTAPRADCRIELRVKSFGIESVMGQDQDQHHLIFLPGQADWHYQHLCRCTGTVTIGDRTFEVNGRGGKDHSWGPRNWHAKIYLRWLIGMVDDDFGFMLTRAVGPTKKTRSGCVWQDGQFHIVDDFEMRNVYADGPNYELLRTDVVIHAGDREWRATGTPQHWVPLRHRQPGPDGSEATLRIVKSPTSWIIDGHEGAGMCEYHDLMVAGVPVALDD
ncbi:MAG: hypothetical protein Q7V88_11470 [Actinomycetota bacterium]|nr:hypothetical protein [Actinomycetota bacterium]